MDKIEQAKKLAVFAKNPELAQYLEAQNISDKLEKVVEAISNIQTPEKVAMELPGVELVTVKGEQGEKGEDGKDGADGKDGIDGQNGKDGIDGKDGYTPIKGIDYFDGGKGEQGDPGISLPGKDGSPDSGLQIIQKINDTPTDSEELLIDASHIKNLPKEVSKHTVGFQRNVAWFDETTLVVDNPTRIKVVGAGAQLSMDSEGSLVLTISGGASANESNGELLTDSGDHINFTFANPPISISAIFRGEPGQYQTPDKYSTLGVVNLVGTTLTFNTAQVDGDGLPFTIYANSTY